jgi:hypothetical protein
MGSSQSGLPCHAAFPAMPYHAKVDLVPEESRCHYVTPVVILPLFDAQIFTHRMMLATRACSWRSMIITAS